jgi:predicted dehydrogenase
MNRRSFLMTPGLFPAAGAASWAGANDRARLGIVGVRGRGNDHIKFLSQIASAQVAAVCDVDQTNVERAQASVIKLGQPKPSGFADMRRMFDDKSIDAVTVANTNHWHALSTIWAARAGKDVYVEKPASHNISEGRKMVEAARKYKRIVHVGMQSRTTPHKIRAIELLREGVIGQVYMAKGLCFKRRVTIGKSPDGPPPPGVDYDAWLGPAPKRPFNPNRFHYTWHWFWDYGNGDIGNQGVHELDICRWGLGLNGHPGKVTSTGAKFVYDDDQETPNTQHAVFDYGKVQIHFEVRGLLTNGEGAIQFDGSNTIGNIFYGSDGYMTVDSQGFKVHRGEKHQLVMDEKVQGIVWDTKPQFENFLAAVRSRRQEDLAGDILEGHLSASLCHLANISYRTGRALRFDPAAENFGGDAEANALLTRHYRPPYTIPDPL